MGPHTVRLRPASHAQARIETYGLHVDREHRLAWQRDALGNRVARVLFRPDARFPSVSFTVEMVCEIQAVNPFDFTIDPRLKNAPFAYPNEHHRDLAPFMRSDDPVLAGGPLLDAFSKTLPRDGDTVALLVELNRLVSERVRYIIREEAGVYSPEETLSRGQGSCRDSALLLVRLLRDRGFATRFVSGYLVQLRDDGMLPGVKKGMDRDVVDLHAWAEVYLPGAGWIGLDATSGLLAGEGHIPLVSSTAPELAAPIEGTAEMLGALDVTMEVERLTHEPEPVRPYSDEEYKGLLVAAKATDDELARLEINLTIGGEPTWTSRLHPDAPEWVDKALGATKTEQGFAFAKELQREFATGGCLLRSMGKSYPGEALPRWVLWVLGAKDGTPIFADRSDLASATRQDSERFAIALAHELNVGVDPLPAFEDPWRFLQDEATLPVDVDLHSHDLKEESDRARLARILDRGVKEPVGYVLPLARIFGKFRSDHWRFRRERLYLVPGDSPIGLRLPLESIAGDMLPIAPEHANADPRRQESEHPEAVAEAWQKLAAFGPLGGMRTALCVEAREGRLYVFLPPFTTTDDFLAALRAIDHAREKTKLDVQLEGYPPPKRSELVAIMLAPDPGVLELNLPPTDNTADYADFLDRAFQCALRAGLTSEKYLLDGRLAGSGGGNHVTLGGPTAARSVFIERPDVLASLLTFAQHHPSLSYAFTGLFVGPTSQAPRVDEGRLDALSELEIALAEAFAVRQRSEKPEPWLSDRLFRDLLVDLTGNGHRAEICIDKLFDYRTEYGRQGVVELRAFEMPPHPHMAVAQGALMRSLIASFVKVPYNFPLVHWGARLHDEFFLPYYLERDLDDILAHLDLAGASLPRAAYRPFVALRCPLVGTLQADDVEVSLRNALEPWHVLGEELTSGGTARYVDSSVERVEVRVKGYIAGRHALIVNGIDVPLHATREPGLAVAGVRYRAWAPPRSMQSHLGIHHPLKFELVDLWASRSLGACAYHVWHPEGRAFEHPPLTRFEAEARRAQRFTIAAPSLAPVQVRTSNIRSGARTLDLRRSRGDRPVPEPIEDPEADA